MKVLSFCVLLLFGTPAFAQTGEPAPATPAPPPVTAPVPEAKPAPVRPKPVERPADAPPPKPRPAAKPPEPPRPAAAEMKADESTPVASTAPEKAAPAGAALGCWALAFAMLIAGFAAGFLWRHQMSRRKLGGMSVRIGTWRGIP